MALCAGTRLGPYEILASIGSGGMGEVYRARDSKLNRHVAIKVLTDRFAGDPDRLRRLQREAQVLAALNHPQIATIHGLEESDGICAIVMELVEGEDLARRITRGPIAVDEVLHLARQIADALEAAHNQGIVHRDLKPANVKIRNDGALKVLDFGLAKAMIPDVAFAGAAHAESPTLTSPHALTAPGGLLMGTAAYMSPEQARGKPVDKRADIWAFGCVVYEMLTGRSPFPGDTISDTVAAVLEREPEWARLPPNTPRAVRRLLRRCLEKDPKRRLHDIADARLEIDDIETGANEPAAAPQVGVRPRVFGWPAAMMTIGLLAAGGAGWWALHRAPAASEARLEINTAPTTDPSLAISPDGRKVVFVGRSGGRPQLFIRSLDSSSAQPLPGTERGSRPFWSPDNRSIGFFADTKLKRIDIDGSSSRVLASNCAVPIGGTWNSEGTILYADNPGGPIFRTSAEGATPVAVTQVQVPQQRGHHFPQFLPDGRHFLFFVSSSAGAQGVYIAELDHPGMKRLFDAKTPAVYASTGHLLFGREHKLMAQRFNVDRFELVGDAFVIEDNLTGIPELSASVAGTIAYRMLPSDAGQRQLVWLDRSGREMDKVVYPESAAQGPSLSHDGRRVAVFRYRDGNMDIWVYEIARRSWERITFDPGDDIYPLWSPDDASIAFAGFRNARLGNLYVKLLGAPPGSEKLLLSTPEGKYLNDWSTDGQFLLFNSLSATTGPDIWAVPVGGDPKPFEVVRTEFNEGLAQFSPDGKWIAYQSDKTGREEIYLRPFRGPGTEVRVSPDGGAQVRWNRNGKELFYVAADDRLAAVPIQQSPDDKTIDPGKPSPLFVTNIGSTAILKYKQQYAVSPDGQSFVMQSVVGQTSSSPIMVILNWKPGR